MDKLKFKPAIEQIDKQIESLKIGLTKKQRKVLSVYDQLLIIRDTVAHHYAVPSTVLSGKSRARMICEPRQVAQSISEKLIRTSLSSIGAFYNRDHATVIHSKKAISNLMETDTYKNHLINKIIKECEEKILGAKKSTETTIFLDAYLTKSITFSGISDEEIASIKNKLGI